MKTVNRKKVVNQIDYVESAPRGDYSRDVSSLVQMLTYMRPHGTVSHSLFCERYLEPIFGKPDFFGNYICRVGESNIAFMSHHDTVHNSGGIQKVQVTNGIAHLPNGAKSNCLGADCTTGIWLMLEMISAKVSGLYIVHAEEESGCKGSRYIVNSNPDLFNGIDFAISFDRKGRTSIITHQMGMRTASDKFAESFAAIMPMELIADDSGSYTDSNEYAADISECTNLSVGYLNQHTSYEVQDLHFAAELADGLISAKWSELVAARDPADYDSFWGDPYSDYGYTNDFYGMSKMVSDYPDEVADILERLGVDAESLKAELGL